MKLYIPCMKEKHEENVYFFFVDFLSYFSHKKGERLSPAFLFLPFLSRATLLCGK